MYRIGEFSYLFNVTIKTLRHYDKIDLFKPAFTDPYTGYRYYKEEQKDEFANILKLKSLNFSLEEIKKLKDNLSIDTLNKKIFELQEEELKIKHKIAELEKISKGDNNMKDYIIGFSIDKYVDAFGKRIVLEKKDDEILEKYFKEIENKLRDLNISCEKRTKVVVTLEIGYEEENVELFIGYRFHKRELSVDLEDKLREVLEPFGLPPMDYIETLDIKDKKNLPEVCKKMIEYANLNKLQIIGSFTELYNSKGEIDVLVAVNDLKREIALDIRDRRRLNKIYEEYKKDNRIFDKYFKDNKEIIGIWKIKEILPNIDFNPNIQKSIPDTKFKELIIYENGNTNYDNVRWSDNNLFIAYNDEVIVNRIYKLNVDNKEYLEIRMNDLAILYPNASPISYIYEKNK